VTARYGVMLDGIVNDLLVPLLTAFPHEIEAIRQNPEYSSWKITSTIEEHARKTVNIIHEITGNALRKLLMDEAEAKQDVPAFPTWQNFAKTWFGNDNAAAFITFDARLREIRVHLMALDSVRRASAIQAASEAGDLGLEVLLAALAAPAIMPVIEPEQLKEACQHWLELYKPEAFVSLKTIEKAKLIVTSNQDAAKKTVASNPYVGPIWTQIEPANTSQPQPQPMGEDDSDEDGGPSDAERLKAGRDGVVFQSA
jgi:hypothetical protein